MFAEIKKYASAVGAASSILGLVRVFGETFTNIVDWLTPNNLDASIIRRLIHNLIIIHPYQKRKLNFWKDDVNDGF